MMISRTNFGEAWIHAGGSSLLFLKSHVRCEPAVYGADTPGSLFDGEESQWNLDTGLQGCLLRSVLSPDDKVVGVTTPMLYFGSWRTLFCCHVEDMNLASINYLHFGHEKRWYACGPQDSDRFEAVAGAQADA